MCLCRDQVLKSWTQGVESVWSTACLLKAASCLSSWASLTYHWVLLRHHTLLQDLKQRA
jgi:hypothetical protein